MGTADSGPGLQAPTLSPRRALLFLHPERVPGRRGRWGEACTGGGAALRILQPGCGCVPEFEVECGCAWGRREGGVPSACTHPPHPRPWEQKGLVCWPAVRAEFIQNSSGARLKSSNQESGGGLSSPSLP